MKARVFALGACLGLLACGPDDGETSGDPEMNMLSLALRVLPATEEFQGKNLEEWAIEYMRWYYSWTSPDCATAENDRDGSFCDFNQPADSPVFFFGSSDYSRTADTVVERTLCKVPAGKAIMVPLNFIGDDNAGAFEDELRSDDEIIENVDEIHETMRGLYLIADQNEVAEADLAQYSIYPTSFDFNVGATPNWHSCNGFDDVENTTIDPSFFAGYFALIAPPTPGKHRLEYGGVYSYFERDYYRRVDSLFEVTAD
jgi:hypothetical protein